MKLNITKNTKYLWIVIGAIAIIALITFAICPFSTAYAEDINYDNAITISNADGGFSYGNNGTFLFDASLQNIFDSIASLSAGNVIVNFDDVSTSESLVLSYDKIVVLQGQISFSGSENSFIDVNKGELRIQGADVNSISTAITVEPDAKCSLLSGNVKTTVNGGNVWLSTVVNKGSLVIDGGAVRFSNSDENRSGYAIQQYSQNANLVMTKGIIEGNSGIVADQGLVKISGGTITATQSYYKNTLNGCAIKVSNNGNLLLNGGTVSSVTPDRAVLLEGGFSSSAEYSAGVINGNIRFGYGGSTGTNTKLSIAGKTVYSTANGNVYAFSDSGTINSIDDVKLGVDCKEGFYIKSWTGNVTENEPYLKDFSSSDVTATLDNSYDITIVLGDRSETFSYEYNSSIYPDILGITPPEGFEVEYWLDDNGERVFAPFVASRSNTYTAILAIADVSLPNFEDVDKIYDGKSFVIASSVTEYDGISYVYEWQRKETVQESDETGGITVYEKFIAKSTDVNYEIKNVPQSGTYRLCVVMTAGNLLKTQYGNEFVVNIAKGDYSSVTVPSLSGVYDSTKTLGDYELEEGFYWENDKIVPTVKNSEYSAIYCLDPDNYNPTNVIIRLYLEKAAGVERTYGSFGIYPGSYVYDSTKTLGDYTLSDGWRWQNESLTPTAGDNAYEALYNPDRDNYFDYSTTITLMISKAKYSFAASLSYDTPYSENLTVGQVVDGRMPENYFLKNDVDENYVLYKTGEFVFAVCYNEDRVNYEDYQTTLMISVSKGVSQKVYPERISVAWSDELTLSDLSLATGFHWKTPETKLTKGLFSYDAVYNPNDSLYNDYSLKIDVLAYDASIVSHRELFVKYSEDLSLSSIELDNGFRWVNPNEKLFVGSYDCLAYTDYSDFGEIIVTVKVTVSKGLYDMSQVVFEDVTVSYDGEYHSITLKGYLPVGVSVDEYYCSDQNELLQTNAGIYKYVVTFSQTDERNYEKVESVSATLTINKIDYDVGDAWKDVNVTYDKTKRFVPLGELPAGVTLKEFIGNDGYASAGVYSVGAVFEQEDTVNHNVLGTIFVKLTIEKAMGDISGDRIQKVVYDGAPKSPSVLATNDEQTVLAKGEYEFTEAGVYKITFYTEDSANYKGVTKEIEFIILAKTIISNVNDGTSLSGRIYSENGIESTRLVFDVIDSDKNSVRFVIKTDDKPITEKYVVTVTIPKNLKKSSVTVYAVCSNAIYAIDYDRNGDEITFIASSSEFIIATESGDSIPSWGWALIAIGIVIALVSITLIVWILMKKKKNIDIFSWLKRRN